MFVKKDLLAFAVFNVMPSIFTGISLVPFKFKSPWIDSHCIYCIIHPVFHSVNRTFKILKFCHKTVHSPAGPLDPPGHRPYGLGFLGLLSLCFEMLASL